MKSQLLVIHPETPQARLIEQAVAIIKTGGVIVYPTDSAYALGCQIANKAALDRIRVIRQLTDKHPLTLVCRDLSELGSYAVVQNSAFRLLKACTPGPYTFILKANREVPRRLLHPKRNTIGLRVPNNKICQALLTALNEPLMSISLILPGEELPLADPAEIYAALKAKVDLVIDGGGSSTSLTTVIDCVEGEPKIIRAGLGSTEKFSL